MRSMFRPIKKIFTYIQKNASNGTMFGTTTSMIKPEDEGAAATSSSGMQLEPEEELEQQQRLPLEQEVQAEEQLQLEDEDIERQIKTSIIDASKVHAAAKAKLVLPLQLQLDDELADFAHEPIALTNIVVREHVDDDDDLEEQFLELENFPNNEIIVLSDQDLNSSLASDNISEDPLAIDDFGQKEADDEEEEADSSGDLMWLKLDTPTSLNSTSNSRSVLPVPSCSSSLQASTSATVTPVKPPTRRREEELRSDGGSDSGLGSENDRHNTTASTTSLQKPLRSNLKRRLDDDAMELALLPTLSACSNTQKRPKRSINFDNVKIYYFPRQQGFGCVPTTGGCTLGMGARHIAFKTLTLAEHASELRRAHRSQNQELHQQHQQQQQQLQARGSSSDDSEESEEDYLSEGSGSDADDGSNGFLQPVTPKQRRVLLKAAGVRKIDASEKIDCRDIRNSREVCGCSCREFCDPETCACSQAGIKCQVDRAMFPCGCTREACGNTVGRVEFNPTRVRTHYIHTVMRLDMEQRQSQGQSSANSSSSSNGLVYASSTSGVVSPSATAGASSSSHCFFMQPQSNYSSGYASPAYTPETSVSYYQQPQTPLAAQAAAAPGLPGNGSTAPQSTYATIYPQLDSLDAGLFASGSNATPSYGELLTPTFHPTLSYGSTQLNSYGSYQPTTATAGGIAVSPVGFSSCAVPSAPPFGIATTTASNATQYQHVNALETTAATMIKSSSSISITASSCATGLARLGGAGPVDFISLNAPINSSSRLSQINDLLQHNRSTTAALVAVSEGYAAVRNSSSSSTATSTTIDSIDTPPIVEEAQRSCMTFEGLPPPLINPTPIVAVLEQPHKQLLAVSTTPQPRQPLDVNASRTESLLGSSSSN